MSNISLDELRHSDDYKELVATRTKYSWRLAGLMLIVYYAYILVIAFKPDLFAIPIAKDAHTTVGMAIGLGVILFSFVLTGYYVHIANTKLEHLVKKLNQQAGE